MELASGEELRVEARLSDDSMASFIVKGTTAKATTPVWTGSAVASVHQPLGALLQREVQDLLSKEPKRQREALLAICCPEVEAIKIKTRLPEAFRKEWDSAWDRAAPVSSHPFGADADRLVATAEAIRADLRAARALAKGATGSRPDAPSAEAMEDLRAKIQRAREALELRGRKDLAARSLLGMRDKLETLRAARGGEGVGEVGEALVLLYAARTIIQGCDSGQVRSCPVCCTGMEPTWWRGMNRFEKVNARIADLESRISAARVAPGAHEIEALSGQIRDAEAILDQPFAPGVMDFIVEPLENGLREGEAARGHLQAWEENRASAAAAAGRVEVLKALSGIADRIVSDVLEGAVASFCRAASETLGDSIVAIQLFDGAKSVCRVGLASGDSKGFRSWKVLSGAERAKLLVGIASAWGAKRQEQIRMVVCDEVWLGRDALAAMCASLREAVSKGSLTQAVVCAVVDYGLEPDGWTVVHL
jgi:hypothetical protein